MNPKERIISLLNHEKPDRMPCFGACSTVTFDQMEMVQAFWPESHEKGEIGRASCRERVFITV